MPEEQPIKQIPFTCTLDCGSRCELRAWVQDGRLVRIDTPRREDTVERPRLVPCARGRAHRRLLDTPERMSRPLRRVGPRGAGEFREVSWDEALDEIAAHLDDTRQSYGAEAVMHATGAGSISGRGFCGSAASRRFFSFWGAVTEAAGNESYYCAAMAALWMLGEIAPGCDRATLLDSRLILLWGMNPAENRMGPNTEYFIAEARDRGARVALIDPRYTDSGILADEWVPIRPGTDAALVAAMAYVMETAALVDRAFLETYTVGYEAYRRYLLGEEDGVRKTPEWASSITGTPVEMIRRLAHDYGTIKPAALLAGWGPQRTLSGEQTARAFVTLACMSGNVGVRGGGLPSVDTRDNIVPVGQMESGPYRPRRNITPGSWAPYILEHRLDPPIKLAYIVASNLINRSPNTRLNVQALEQIDFIVVHDPFLTPTARYADIVLPICTDLERSDLVTSWGHDSHLFDSRQVLDPGERRTDYWIFSRLSERLGFAQAYTQSRDEAEWIEHFLQQEGLDRDALREDGIMRLDGEPRVALAEFRADPAAHPLKTPSGRIEITCPPAQQYGLPLIPAYVALRPAETEGYPLQLVTPHSKQRSHSCLHTNPWLQQMEPHAIWINPQDAAMRSLSDGDLVEVTSAYGVLRLPAKVTGRIMPGVVCLYQGAWYQPGPDGVDEGGCANVLTGHDRTPSGGYATHSAWVEVRRSMP